MKILAKNIIVAVLGWQVRRLRQKHDFKIIAVVGSIGKTSTKFAIARVLGQSKKVRFQEGNYNADVTVPLVFFGQPIPSLMNPLAWAKVLLGNERQIKSKYPYDAVVVELGTDAPGDIISFKKYLRCDTAVVTAITPEHMEFFPSLDDVAKEELSVAEFSDRLLINADLCEAKYYDNLAVKVLTYGTHNDASFVMHKPTFGKNGAQMQLRGASGTSGGTQLDISVSMDAVSVAELYSAAAGAIVSHMNGVSDKQIVEGIKQLKPVSGRMQRLNGIKDSLIIDETYNASPVAVMAALDTLYAMKAPQKIAILGNMNELGSISAQAHTDIGEYCDPKQLDLVVTIGPDANKYLAPAAEKQGCNTATFTDPYSAGEFVRNRLKPNAIILAKGSQNRVFAEEAVKLLLHDPDDEKYLVRQSAAWAKKKAENFGE